MSTEREDAVLLANWWLDRPNADSDDYLAMLSRQFLRALEEISRLETIILELRGDS